MLMLVLVHHHQAPNQENSNRLNVAHFSELSNTLLKERNLRIAGEVVNIAQEIKRTPSQVALNWIRESKKLFRNKIIPIIGAKNLVQINDNLACMEFVLSDDHIERLNEISKIELGFPHDFLSTETIRNIIYGGTFSSIYNHRNLVKARGDSVVTLYTICRFTNSRPMGL